MAAAAALFFSACYSADSPYTPSMPDSALIDGCTFHYRLEGHGDPVVLIQGVGVHGDGWTPQLRALQQNFRCLSFDNRGMGASQPLPSSVSVDGMARDTLALMDHVGFASAHVIGHSMGGCIALQLALEAPARVRTLSLLCTSARGADALRFSARMMWLGARSRIGTRHSRRMAFLEIVHSRNYLATHDREHAAEALRDLFGHDLGDTPSIVGPQLAALKKFDATSRLSALANIPTLVVSAEEDPIFPPRFGRVGA